MAASQGQSGNPNTGKLSFTPDKKSSDALIQFCHQTLQANYAYTNMRNRFELIDKEFYRANMAEKDYLKARLALQQGKKVFINDVCMPVIETQIETSLAFLTSVFLTGEPIFATVAPPSAMMDKKTYDAIMAENSVRGGWAAQLMMALRDGLKYNFMSVEVDWCEETIYSPAMKVVPGRQSQVERKEQVWAGNKIVRTDPYNTLWDARCQLHEHHIYGEFVGKVELMSRLKLKKFIEQLSYKINVKEAFASQLGAGASATSDGQGSLYYIPQIYDMGSYNKERIMGVMNWDSWAALTGSSKDKEFQYKGLYEVATRYIRIIPREFGLAVPNNGQTQIWKLITVNDQVVIFLERQTNAHDMLPILLCQPYNDGLGLQSKGLGEKLIPIQDLASSSWNARLATQRRKVADRAIYDPSKISSSDVNSDNPSAKIPVKANAYGKPVQDAYHAIPFEDRESGTFISDAKEFLGFANSISGQNPAQQGQFVKGNKTQAEYEDIQGHSSGRQRTLALSIENQWFVPMKEILKLNILQYQPDGQVVDPNSGETYNANMATLRQKALTLRVSDGLTPTDKLIDTDSWTVAMQAIMQNEELNEEFDIGGVFTYMMSIKNVDLSPFRRTPQQVTQNNQQDATEDAQAEALKAGAVAHAQASAPAQQPPLQPPQVGQPGK